MTVQRQVGFWIAALVALILFLWTFSSVLLPFVAGLALAYMLDPVADRLERLGLGRLGATLLILAIFVLVFVLLLMLALPIALRELMAFLQTLPSTVTRLQQLAMEHGGPVLGFFGLEGGAQDLERSIADMVSQGSGYLVAFIGSVLAGGQAALSIVSLLVVTPVVAFYVLVDWDVMIRTVDGWLPVRHRETIRGLARSIDDALAGFIRGQAALCLILGSFYAIALSLIGLNFGALIGMTAGVLSFIPYVGSLTGLILSVGVAIVQFWPDYFWIGATLAIFVFGQFVEGNFLSPKLLGRSVGVHPVWLMFALFAFGSLFGFLGLLLAVPLAAIVGVLARFVLGRYLASPYYSEGGRIIAPEDKDA
ncbi:MAG: AI-2E family transporter [Microvirga sp.]|nr:AI-2E family transporter [Microvirga sp.]